MAVLSDANRVVVWEEVVHRWEELVAPSDLLKAEWRTLVNAADDFANTNASVYNTTIPAAVRAKATAQEKALALMLVIAKRYLLGA